MSLPARWTFDTEGALFTPEQRKLIRKIFLSSTYGKFKFVARKANKMEPKISKYVWRVRYEHPKTGEESINVVADSAMGAISLFSKTYPEVPAADIKEVERSYSIHLS